jgi:hypothetical protein
MIARPFWVFLLVGFAMAFSGCTKSAGPPKKVCYPVKGELLVSGKPAEGALVILRPQPEANADEWSAGFPRGRVGADGKFDVETYGEKDGAPAGDYIMLISWMIRDPHNEEAPGTDRLGSRYSDPATSRLTAKVEPRPTELPPIRLP